MSTNIKYYSGLKCSIIVSKCYGDTYKGQYDYFINIINKSIFKAELTNLFTILNDYLYYFSNYLFPYYFYFYIYSSIF